MATPLLVYSVFFLLQSAVNASENISVCSKLHWQSEKDLLTCNSITVSPPFTPKAAILPKRYLGRGAALSLNEFYQNYSLQSCTRSIFYCSTIPATRHQVNLHCYSRDRKLRLEVVETWIPPPVPFDVCLWICRTRGCGVRQNDFRLFMDEEEARLGHAMVRICVETLHIVGEGLDCEYDRYGMFMERQREGCVASRSAAGKWITQAYIGIAVVGVVLSGVTVYVNWALIRRLFAK